MPTSGLVRFSPAGFLFFFKASLHPTEVQAKAQGWKRLAGGGEAGSREGAVARSPDPHQEPKSTASQPAQPLASLSLRLCASGRPHP